MSREFKEQRGLRQRKIHSKINISSNLHNYFEIIPSTVFPILDVRQSILSREQLERRRRRRIQRIKDSLFCRKICKILFGNFQLLFGRLCQRNVLKCVPHMQHGYFSSFNQSYHSFLTMSLLSSLLLLRIREFQRVTFLRHRWKPEVSILHARAVVYPRLSN